MVPSREGPTPLVDDLSQGSLDRSACPGVGIDYPQLYDAHYGRRPDSWLTGIVKKVRTGHAADPTVRLAGASGGVITSVLQYLIETCRINGAIERAQK